MPRLHRPPGSVCCTIIYAIGELIADRPALSHISGVGTALGAGFRLLPLIFTYPDARGVTKLQTLTFTLGNPERSTEVTVPLWLPVNRQTAATLRVILPFLQIRLRYDRSLLPLPNYALFPPVSFHRTVWKICLRSSLPTTTHGLGEKLPSFEVDCKALNMNWRVEVFGIRCSNRSIGC